MNKQYLLFTFKFSRSLKAIYYF